MITLDDYVGPHAKSKDWTPERQTNATSMLERVNALIAESVNDGVTFKINPDTKSLVSGRLYGGFRPQDCNQGAPGSSHKQGLAVDVYDPSHKIAPWCLENLEKLEKHGLYMEHPDATPSWCHLTTRSPKSGRRAFYP